MTESPVQTFATLAEAWDEVRDMHGWDARPVLAIRGWYDDSAKLTWAIACFTGDSDPGYLREDGYVR